VEKTVFALPASQQCSSGMCVQGAVYSTIAGPQSAVRRHSEVQNPEGSTKGFSQEASPTRLLKSSYQQLA